MKPFLLFALACLTLLTVCMAQNTPKAPSAEGGHTGNSVAASPRNRFGEVAWSAEDQDWKKEKWTADEIPYRSIEAALSQRMSSHLLTSDNLREYKDEWNKAPQDPAALYRWVYASRLLYLPTIVDEATAKEFTHFPPDHDDIADAYLRFPLTHSYEFDRLHLLFDINTGDDGYDLIPVLKRFYDRNPSDAPIMHTFASLLSDTGERSHILLAATVADRLLALHPEVPMNHVLFGWCHFVKYMETVDNADYIKAAKGYQDFLKMTPPSDAFRPDATAFLQKTLKHAHDFFLHSQKTAGHQRIKAQYAKMTRTTH